MSGLKGFISETLIYGFANVFSRVSAMLLIPLYASFLGKIEYSNLVMIQSLFTVLTFLLVLNSGVFYYYYEYENKKYRKMIFSSWFFYQVFVGGILWILLVLFSSKLTDLFIVTDTNQNELKLALTILGFQFIPYIFNITNINLFRIDRKPKSVLVITLLEALLTLIVVGTGLLYFDFNLPMIIAGQVCARFAVTLLFIRKSLFYMNIKFLSMKLLRKLVDFAWPFFVISGFSWVIISIDKFIGVETLSDKEDVALLALAMQLTIPIAVLSDMIRMALGPYVMSIRKNKDANEEYQKIFDLTVFSGSMTLIGIVVFTPILVHVLANSTYMEVIYVVPLIAIASVISLISNQFSISFSLKKKNIYILWATLIGGITGVLVNLFFMHKWGYITSGVSQIISYVLMAIFLFTIGRIKTDQDLNLKHTFWMLIIVIGFISFVFYESQNIINGNYLALIFFGGIAFFSLAAYFVLTQKINLKSIVKRNN